MFPKLNREILLKGNSRRSIYAPGNCCQAQQYVIRRKRARANAAGSCLSFDAAVLMNPNASLGVEEHVIEICTDYSIIWYNLQGNLKAGSSTTTKTPWKWEQKNGVETSWNVQMYHRCCQFVQIPGRLTATALADDIQFESWSVQPSGLLRGPRIVDLKMFPTSWLPSSVC